MYKIISNKKLNKDSYEMIVKCPHVIKNFIPGQFVIVMTKNDSERIPLTIYDVDKEKGLVYLIYQVIGASTYELSFVKDEIYSISGPLGNPNEICLDYEKYKDKKILYVAGGVGIAPVYPQVKYLIEKGLDVSIAYGARSKDLLIIRDKIEKLCKVIYCTDDGSYGIKGNVVDLIKDKIDNYDICVVIGPVVMMKYVSILTKEKGIKTIASMNPIMVDGSGMCGACRCKVDGKDKFACIHGPEFDAHKIDFDISIKRMNIYKNEEKIKFEKMKEGGFYG